MTMMVLMVVVGGSAGMVDMLLERNEDDGVDGCGC